MIGHPHPERDESPNRCIWVGFQEVRARARREVVAPRRGACGLWANARVLPPTPPEVKEFAALFPWVEGCASSERARFSASTFGSCARLSPIWLSRV